MRLQNIGLNFTTINTLTQQQILTLSLFQSVIVKIDSYQRELEEKGRNKSSELQGIRDLLTNEVEKENDLELRKALVAGAKREFDRIVSPQKMEPSDNKKVKMEDPAPIEDYYKPDVKKSAMGGPVIKNIRAYKAPTAREMKLKLAASTMRPLTELWKAKG